MVIICCPPAIENQITVSHLRGYCTKLFFCTYNTLPERKCTSILNVNTSISVYTNIPNKRYQVQKFIKSIHISINRNCEDILNFFLGLSTVQILLNFSKTTCIQYLQVIQIITFIQCPFTVS